MPDPEAIVLKTGLILIIILGLVRIVMHECHNIRTDFRRWRKRH
jgi:hypothetical protein